MPLKGNLDISMLLIVIPLSISHINCISNSVNFIVNPVALMVVYGSFVQ